jgi:hypothetical protein
VLYSKELAEVPAAKGPPAKVSIGPEGPPRPSEAKL